MSVEITRWVNNGGQVESQEWSLIDGDNTTVTESAGAKTIQIDASSSGGTWGSITGTLADQTDLQSALDLKADDTDIANSANWDTAYSWGDHSAASYLSDGDDIDTGLNFADGALLLKSSGGTGSFGVIHRATALGYISNAIINWYGEQGVEHFVSLVGDLTVSATTTLAGGTHSGTNTGNETATTIRALGFFDITNDGEGSGLDADLLDGNHASAFATAAQGSLADSAVQPSTAPTLTGTNFSGTAASLTAGAATLAISTSALKSATTTVNVDAATAPTTGQVLTATSSTAATWQTAAGGGDLSAADIDTLAELNAIITDATLIDTGDSRLSDARTPTAHNHTASEVTDFSTAADARIGAAVLDDLADVTETTITAGDLLRWSGSAWVNYADSNFATGAEGDLAASALQVGDNISDLTNDLFYITPSDGLGIFTTGGSTSANLRAVLSDETGTGAAVFATSPTLVTPILGTPTSGTLTNCTFPTLNQNTTGTAANVTGTVAVANGGTGRTTGTTAYCLIATGTTAAGVQQTLGSGGTTQILVGGGASALPVWTTATGSGAPVRATSPTLVTPILGTPTSGNASNLTALNATQLTTGTIPAARVGADHIDALTEIAAALKAGTGAKLATNGNDAELPIYTEKHAASHTISAAECYGGVHYVTAAATITLPAVAAGMSVTVITVGAIAVSVKPNASDLLRLEGTALDDGDKATNLSTSGDMIVLTYYDATGWHAASNGWTDGGP